MKKHRRQVLFSGIITAIGTTILSSQRNANVIYGQQEESL